MRLWQKSTRKLLSAGIASIFITGTPLYASHQDSYPSSDTKQEMCPITPNAGPKTEWKADPFFTLDFIYWTPR